MTDTRMWWEAGRVLAMVTLTAPVIIVRFVVEALAKKDPVQH